VVGGYQSGTGIAVVRFCLQFKCHSQILNCVQQLQNYKKISIPPHSAAIINVTRSDVSILLQFLTSAYFASFQHKFHITTNIHQKKMPKNFRISKIVPTFATANEKQPRCKISEIR
jgi:hypothetical protein